MNNKTSQLNAYSIFFLVVVFFAFVVQLFVSDISLTSISEKYLWRKSLIKGFNNFRYQMGDRVFANAVIGKDGWFYYTGDMSIQDYQKTSPMNVGNIKRLVDILNQFNDTVDQYGGSFFLVIPPDKSTTYPQYMPDEIPVIGQISSLDRLVERINKFSDIQVLDLRPILEKASQASQTYYKTDSHWNCVGAFYAYDAIISSLADSHPEIKSRSFEDFEIITTQNSLLDVASLMGVSVQEDSMGVLPRFDTEVSMVPVISSYNAPSLQVAASSEKDAPDLMIFHDSFYDACLNSFIETSFSYTTSIHYGDAALSDHLDMIKTEKPDIVIVEFVERQMEFFLRHLGD